MPSYPHTALFVGAAKSIVASGPHIQVLDSQTGSVLQSTAAFADGSKEKEDLVKAGPIRCLDVSADFTHIAASGEDKRLKVWRVEDLALLSERELPKKPTDIQFTRDGQTILVSDKFGDIFSYSLHPEPTQPSASEPSEASKKRDSILSHENPSNGTLILGHTSLLTSFILTEDEKYVVSADRDEHVRVSWYPQGHVIERFCLGHQKYVTSVHIPKFSPSTLVSGGGDLVLKLWDWMSGEHLSDIPILESVEPFIAVKPPKGLRLQDGEGETEKRVKRKRRGRKGKGKADAEGGDAKVAADDAEGAEDVAMDEEKVEHATVDETEPQPPAEEAGPSSQVEEAVLVVRRVASADIPGQGRFLLFSAVGATSLFYTAFPEDLTASLPSSIQALGLQKPVIDFTIDNIDRVWVLVDGEREGMGESKQSLVRLLAWSDGKLAEVAENNLLGSLNTPCLIPATAADLNAVDVYAQLSSMPKNVDPEHDPLRRNGIDSLEAPEDGSSRGGTPQPGKGKAPAREMTQREAARLKRKQALAAKIQEKSGDAAATDDTAEGPETKKIRQDVPTAQREGDVVMTESV